MQLIVSGPNKLLRQKYIESLFPPSKTAYLTPVFEAPKNIKVEAIRDLLKDLITDTQIERLVYLEDAQKLTPASQNTLLKILEEPPKRTHFIFSLDNHLHLLPTILSRCTHHQMPYQKESVNPEALLLIKKLMSQNTAQRLGYLSVLGKDRQTNLDWLTQIITSLHSSLDPSSALKSQLILQQILQNTLTAQQRLAQNANPTLTMGNYLLSLPRTV
jgi:DNA polymerase III delta prime subunit